MEELYKQFYEAGDLHSPHCCTNDQFGCDTDIGLMECCDNMIFIKRQFETFINGLNLNAWCDLSEQNQKVLDKLLKDTPTP
uniref:Uncharacterized protein n=1 Tax=viral metagenome TaxID=1070528 RepID=A0A6M3JG66_9ZZZZ